MNKNETLALYEKGREAWNAWAAEMLAKQNELKAIGQWQLQGENWSQMAAVDFFSTHVEDANFTDFEFPGHARFTRINCEKTSFDGARFFGAATFDESHFHIQVTFDRATFTKHVTFNGVAFHNSVRFTDAVFEEGATFGGTHFYGDVDFTSAKFRKSTRFNQVAFDGRAGFSQVRFIKHVGFKGTTFRKEVHFDETIFYKGATFSRARFLDFGRFTCSEFNGNAVFTKSIFDGNAYFKGTRFSGSVKFDEVEFKKNAVFTETRFTGNANFICAEFRGDAMFANTIFVGRAMFSRAQFNNNAVFNEAKFRAYVEFTQAVFESNTTFPCAIFEEDSAFVAIRGLSFFTLENATFLSVPDFGQAHFEEAPRLDNARFYQERAESRKLLGYRWPVIKPDTTARWRALKRLAIQAHDHQRELDFLAKEVKSLRGIYDKLLPNPSNLFKGEKIWPGGGRYWAGLFYQIFSKFGRSTLRPLVGWITITLLFALYYLSPHLEPLDWSSDDVISAISALSCISQTSSSPLIAAIYLSVHNGLVISGLGRSEKLIQSYACLYGNSGKDQLVPIMPDEVVFAGIVQTILSAILIFLFLLALRNYFRIK